MIALKNKSLLVKYGYLWATLVLFLGSLAGHWSFAWPAYVSEQEEHGAPVEIGDFTNHMLRDTFENWQSEFLQLIWQVAGLAYLIYLGSPQSKEGDERKEDKIDAILLAVDPKNGGETIKNLDRKYGRA